MHDGKRTRGDTSTLEVEDVLTVGLLDDEFVDRDYLREVFREPSKYLPPRRRRPRRDLEDLEPESESRLARRAKLAGLTAAVTVLIAAVVAAAVLAERPREQEAAATPRRAISGIEALGALTPVEPRGSLATPGASGAAASRPGSYPTETTAPTTAQATGQATEPTAEPTTESAGESAPEKRGNEPDQADSSSPRSTAPDIERDRSARVHGPETETRTSRSANKLGTVREFYRLVADSPTTALSMLDPEVLGDELGEVLGIWHSLAEVRPHEVRERADGSVLAVVTMLYGDGERVRVTQLLDFRDGQVIIDHVQLLSAQHV